MAWYEDKMSPNAMGKLQFGEITSVVITSKDTGEPRVEVTGLGKTYCFKVLKFPPETLQVAFLRYMSFGRKIPLIGDLEFALPSYIRQRIEATGSGEFRFVFLFNFQKC